MRMCLAVWLPLPQLQRGEGTVVTRAWYRKALKPFFPVRSCTASDDSGFRRCWCRAKTSVPGGASMDVELAG